MGWQLATAGVPRAFNPELKITPLEGAVSADIAAGDRLTAPEAPRGRCRWSRGARACPPGTAAGAALDEAPSARRVDRTRVRRSPAGVNSY